MHVISSCLLWGVHVDAGVATATHNNNNNNTNRQLQLILCISASQVIIEMLFMGMNPNPTNNFLSQAPPIARELTVVEENAIFYAGGYVL